jgi:hypothetical protein
MRLPFKSLEDHIVEEETGNNGLSADLILRRMIFEQAEQGLMLVR